MLTTTKYFFEKVASGEKTVEYRRDIPYYHAVHKARPKVMVLHYRRGVFIVCRIRRCRYIDRPSALEKSVFITTPKCFAFEIAEKSPIISREHVNHWASLYWNQ